MGMSAVAAAWLGITQSAAALKPLGSKMDSLSIMVWALLLGLLAVCCHRGCMLLPLTTSFRVLFAYSGVNAFCMDY